MNPTSVIRYGKVGLCPLCKQNLNLVEYKNDRTGEGFVIEHQCPILSPFPRSKEELIQVLDAATCY